MSYESSFEVCEKCCRSGGMSPIPQMGRAPTTMAVRPGRSKGIALIAGLWLIALLTMLCTAVVSLSVNHRRSVSRYEQMIQADLTDDSAIRLVLLKFIERSMSADVDLQQSIDVSGVAVDVTLAREIGRV